MIEVLACRFCKCLEIFNRLTVARCSVTVFFRDWSNQVFNFENREAMRVVTSSNCLKFDDDFRNGAKNWEKGFCFYDKSIWIGYGKFSQLNRKHLPSGVNVLTNGLNVSHITNRDIFQLNFPEVTKNIIELLSCIFCNYLKFFNRITIEWSCLMGLFRHWSNQVFGSW